MGDRCAAWRACAASFAVAAALIVCWEVRKLTGVDAIRQWIWADRDPRAGRGLSVASLHSIRNAIELFRICHDGCLPPLGTYISEGGWGDQYEGGIVGGDYLRCAPMNYWTGTSNVVVGTPGMKPAKKGDPGWYWDGERIWLNGFDEAKGAWIEDISR